MTGTQALSVAGCVLGICAGQILLKAAASRHASEGLAELLTDWRLVAALAVYGVSTVGWVLVLRSVPLSTAYAFLATSFVLVPAAGVVLLGESVGRTFWIGAALIAAGIVVCARA